ncbi:hypothetical protein GCM10027452_08140 [Micromonospora halotolerans]
MDVTPLTPVGLGASTEMGSMEGARDGPSWRVGTPGDVAWIAGKTTALHRDPLVKARRVGTEEDALPPGLTRD